VKRTLKEYRKIRQLSQRELSDESGVSIRTIQRIEKDLSSGSPYVIKSLCRALKIEIDDLEVYIAQNEIHENDTQEKNVKDKVKPYGNLNQKELKLINLSSISVLLFPLLNLLFPAILYWKFRLTLNSKSDALKILSFQILWTLITLLLVIFIPFLFQIFFSMVEIFGHPLFFWIYFICVVMNIFITIITAIKLNKSENILTFIPNIL
jgi:transcriptional regulator with XRE-family HTH domain